jgi:hypothetical protein
MFGTEKYILIPLKTSAFVRLLQSFLFRNDALIIANTPSVIASAAKQSVINETFTSISNFSVALLYTFKILRCTLKGLHYIFKMLHYTLKMLRCTFKEVHYIFKMLRCILKGLRYTFKMLRCTLKVLHNTFEKSTNTVKKAKYLLAIYIIIVRLKNIISGLKPVLLLVFINPTLKRGVVGYNSLMDFSPDIFVGQKRKRIYLKSIYLFT